MTRSGALDPRDEASDVVAIRRLQSAYADVVSRRAWPELTELFLADARIEVDTRTADVMVFHGAAALGTFIAGAIERFAFFEFVILNSVVELAVDGNPDTARARVWMCELRTDAATGAWNNAFGVYHDRYQRVDGAWRFAHRRYHSLARTAAEPHLAEAFGFPTDVDPG